MPHESFPSEVVPPGDERIAIPIQATGYVRLHVPDALPQGPAPLLVAVHGYRQPPQAMLDYAISVAPHDAIVLAPEGPSAFYGPRVRERAIGRRVDYGWIADPRRPDSEARNRSLLVGALAHACTRHRVDPARTWLLGFSQGVGVAVDFALHERERIAGVVGLAGGVPPPGRAALDRLTAAGAALETLELDAGHDLLAPAREAVRAWLAVDRS